MERYNIDPNVKEVEMCITDLEERVAQLENRLSCKSHNCKKMTVEDVREKLGIKKERLQSKYIYTQHSGYNLKIGQLYWWRKSYGPDKRTKHYDICEKCHKFDKTLEKPTKIREFG